MNDYIELSEEQMLEINGGTYLSKGLGFLYGSLEALGKVVWDVITTPGADSETLMNCI